MKTFYQHLIVGWAALLVLMSALAGGFLHRPTAHDDMRSAPAVDISSRTVTGSYFGQPITEGTGQRWVPQWHRAQW